MSADTQDIQELLLKAAAKKKQLELGRSGPASSFDASNQARAAAAQRLISGMRQTGAGVLGTITDLADPGAGLGTRMQDRFAFDEARRMSGVPENPAMEFAGQVAPYAALPLSAEILPGRLALSAGTGGFAGANAAPGNRLEGAAGGAAAGLAVQGGIEGLSGATRWIVDHTYPIVAAARRIGDEATSLVDKLLPRGSKGFAGDLAQSISLRMDKLAQRRDAVWNMGLSAAREASGGNVVLSEAPKMREVIQEELQTESIPEKFANGILDDLGAGMNIDTLNATMVKINRLAKSPNLEKAAAASNVRRALLDDLKDYKGPGVDELAAMRKAYAPIAQKLDEVRDHVLGRIFGVGNIKEAGSIADEVVLKKFSNLKPSEQARVMNLLRTNAPAVAKQARGVVLESAIQAAPGMKVAGKQLIDPNKLLRNISGDGRSIKLAGMMSPDEQQGMLNLASAWTRSYEKAKVSQRNPPDSWSPGRLIQLAARSGGDLLAYVRTTRTINNLAFTEEGQNALRALMTKDGVIQDAAAADFWLDVAKHEGWIKEDKRQY